jgi:hypothetical protein
MSDVCKSNILNPWAELLLLLDYAFTYSAYDINTRSVGQEAYAVKKWLYVFFSDMYCLSISWLMEDRKLKSLYHKERDISLRSLLKEAA